MLQNCNACLGVTSQHCHIIFRNVDLHCLCPLCIGRKIDRSSMMGEGANTTDFFWLFLCGECSEWVDGARLGCNAWPRAMHAHPCDGRRRSRLHECGEYSKFWVYLCRQACVRKLCIYVCLWGFDGVGWEGAACHLFVCACVRACTNLRNI